MKFDIRKNTILNSINNSFVIIFTNIFTKQNFCRTSLSSILSLKRIIQFKKKNYSISLHSDEQTRSLETLNAYVPSPNFRIFFFEILFDSFDWWPIIKSRRDCIAEARLAPRCDINLTMMLVTHNSRSSLNLYTRIHVSGNGEPSRQLARCLFLVPPVAELARIIYRFRGRVPVIPEGGGQAT